MSYLELKMSQFGTIPDIGGNSILTIIETTPLNFLKL